MMTRRSIQIPVGFLAAILIAAPTRAAERPPLDLVRTIAMPGVEGRIDHLAADLKEHRLFVAALGNNTLEVLDLQQGKRLHTITGLREPQGVAYLPHVGRIAVANGDDGSCRFFDSLTYQPIASIDCKADADNVRYDAHANRLYVGYGKGALAEIDLAKLTRLFDIPLAGHPESFQLESQ
jgi:WD40 repeat protein